MQLREICTFIYNGYPIIMQQDIWIFNSSEVTKGILFCCFFKSFICYIVVNQGYFPQELVWKLVEGGLQHQNFI